MKNHLDILRSTSPARFHHIFLPSFLSLFFLSKKGSEEGDAPPPSRRWCGGAKWPRRRVVVFFERRREQQQRRTGKEEGVRARPASREKTTDDDVRGRESPKLSTRKRFGYRDEEDANNEMRETPRRANEAVD